MIARLLDWWRNRPCMTTRCADELREVFCVRMTCEAAEELDLTLLRAAQAEREWRCRNAGEPRCV